MCVFSACCLCVCVLDTVIFSGGVDGYLRLDQVASGRPFFVLPMDGGKGQKLPEVQTHREATDKQRNTLECTVQLYDTSHLRRYISMLVYTVSRFLLCVFLVVLVIYVLVEWKKL